MKDEPAKYRVVDEFKMPATFHYILHLDVWGCRDQSDFSLFIAQINFLFWI